MNIIEKMTQDGLLDRTRAEEISALVRDGAPPDKALLKSGVIDEETALRYLAAEMGLEFIDVENCQPRKELLAQFPARTLLERKILPIEAENGVVTVAVSRVFDTTGVDELRLLTGKRFKLAIAPSAEIERSIKKHLGIGADTIQSMVSEAGEQAGLQVVDEEYDEDIDLEDAAGDASVVRFVNQVLAEAVELRATDVHFEPYEEEFRVRYRVDGVLQEATIPAEIRRFQAAIVSRLKILSRLDIAEKRLPQDGRIRLKVAGREVDVRVSVIPMLNGEAIVLRLLDRSSALLGLEQLGMSAEDEGKINKILELPHGIVLVTGPTGSGKTTTLYAGLSRINDIQRKIITIEDPVEYHLFGVNQIQVSAKTGLTFARGLRSILRHDPDVVLVGEIRDRETADIAVQASLTGHLVFSTLHTNDAPGALTRLVDMGLEPYLVTSSLEAVIAQRLVRLICPDCKEEYLPPDIEALAREMGGNPPEKLYRGVGCRKCQGSGYRGRMGIFEIMLINEPVRRLIMERASTGDIRNTARGFGMKSLREDGWRLVREGRTTVEEVLRVSKDERIEENGIIRGASTEIGQRGGRKEASAND